MQAGEARAGQEEDTLVVVHSALAIVDSLGIHQGVGVEELRGRAEGRRAAQVLAILQVRAIADVRLAGIHPPRVDAQRIVVLVHLVPEELAGVGCVSIVEAVGVAGADPILQTILDGEAVHPSFLVELLEVLRSRVEFRPDGNHHPPVHGVDGIDHRLRIGETRLVELVATPSVLGPVIPVEDDVVDRNLPVAEALERTEHLVLRVVFLAALPVAHSPLGHDRRLAREGAVAGDNVVHVVPCDEVIIQLLRHLAPPRLFGLLLGSDGLHDAEAGVGDAAVGLPFDLEGDTLARLEVDGKLIAVGVPRRAPTLGDN